MDDIGFNIPKKILPWLVLAILLVVGIWGRITGTEENFAATSVKAIRFFIQPRIDSVLDKINKIPQIVDESFRKAREENK